jgi:excisionase family DNA binding protein
VVQGANVSSAAGLWLSLGQASRLLGITPATLRRWADQGEVATFVTPGGHRRFPRSVIEGMVPHVRSRRPTLAGLGASPERMALAYRRARPVERGGNPHWLAGLSEVDRAEFRERGRRLLGIVLEHLDAGDRALAGELLDKASGAAAEYGALSRALGASLTETLELFLRFRASFVGELAGVARRRRLDTREATALLVAAEAAMDRLLVALMKGFEGGGRSE